MYIKLPNLVVCINISVLNQLSMFKHSLPMKHIFNICIIITNIFYFYFLLDNFKYFIIFKVE